LGKCRNIISAQQTQLVAPNAKAYGAREAETSTATPAIAPSACPIQRMFMQALRVEARRGFRALISNGNTRESSRMPVRYPVSSNVSSRITQRVIHSTRACICRSPHGCYSRGDGGQPVNEWLKGVPRKKRYTATFGLLLRNSQKHPLHYPLRSGWIRYILEVDLVAAIALRLRSASVMDFR
jgi:hypothetical protein